MIMQISQRGIDLIKKLEGFSEEPYVCPAGENTIGYGHVITTGEVYIEISEAKAEQLLRKDAEWAGGVVNRNVKAPLNQNQFDALVSFVFNVGAGQKGVKDGFVVLKSGEPSTMLKMLNAFDYAGAARQFNRWINSKGKPLNGLIRRRQAERELFEEAV